MAGFVGLLLLAGAIVVALAVPFLVLWVPVRAVRGRARLRRTIEDRGHRVQRMELRWLTRGPFDMRPAGLKYGDWLYRVLTEDRERRPRVAWIRWRPGLPWQTEDHWEIHWDDSDPKPRGLPTAIVGSVMLAGAGIAILLIYLARGR